MCGPGSFGIRSSDIAHGLIERGGKNSTGRSLGPLGGRCVRWESYEVETRNIREASTKLDGDKGRREEADSLEPCLGRKWGLSVGIRAGLVADCVYQRRLAAAVAMKRQKMWILQL